MTRAFNTPTDLRLAFDERVRELNRMPKASLASRWRKTHPNTIWTATPPIRWSKDSLINEILDAEFDRDAVNAAKAEASAVSA